MPTRENSKDMPRIKRLIRSSSDKVLGGVAAGIAEYFDTDATLIRLGFILLFIFGGSGLLLYLILWLVVPAQGGGNASDHIKENTKEIKAAAKNLAESIAGEAKSSPRSNSGAILLIGLGMVFLLTNLGWFDWADLHKFWPIVLIGLGFVMLTRNRQ